MNTNVLGALNGVALAALTANPPDMNTASLMQQMLQMYLRVGSTYDSAATNTSTLVLQQVPPYGPFGNWDAIQQALAQNSGLTAAELGA